MTKYNEEFKTRIVQEYLDGSIGFEALAAKYGIKSKTQVQNWVAAYRALGAEGLAVKTSRTVYSADFKRQVLDYLRQTGASYTEVALHFNITNPSTVAQWHANLRKGGEAALLGKHGR